MEEEKSFLENAGAAAKTKSASLGMLAPPNKKAAGFSSCGFSSVILQRPVLLRP
jgi:hypothetical protein